MVPRLTFDRGARPVLRCAQARNRLRRAYATRTSLSRAAPSEAVQPGDLLFQTAPFRVEPSIGAKNDTAARNRVSATRI